MDLHYRSVFLSDAHLGTRGAKAAELWTFLRHVQCERMYLVGDIIDLWVLKNRVYWPVMHSQVVRRILKLAKKGVHIAYIPGNHDDALRQYLGVDLGGVRIAKQAIHRTADGKSLLITHGDEYDLVVQNQRFLSILGGWAYDHLVTLNRVVNAGRGVVGLRPWSFSAAIKRKVKSACTFMSNYEQALLAEARRRNLDGVVCGHIHQPALRTCEGAAGSDERPVIYANCGDWIERATALVEHHDGRLELVDVDALIARCSLEVPGTDADETVHEPGEAISGPVPGFAELLV